MFLLTVALVNPGGPGLKDTACVGIDEGVFHCAIQAIHQSGSPLRRAFRHRELHYHQRIIEPRHNVSSTNFFDRHFQVFRKDFLRLLQIEGGSDVQIVDLDI